jgi:mono/diheme cytochrome c family protein
MRHLAVAGTFALTIFFSGPFRLAGQQGVQQAKAAAPVPTTAVPNRALLDQYCVTCHNQRAKTAGLMFDTMDLSHAGADAAVWERAVRKLRGGMMPPPGSRRPDQAAVDSFLTSLEAALDQAAAANPNPGSVTLHRLNRVEYANAIRDMFAIDVDAAALLPTDDVSNGFDNIASVLKVSPSFLDQYITAARAVSLKAIGVPPPSKPVTAALTATPGADPTDLPLGARGGTVVEHLFPFDGEYEFRAPAGGSVLLLDGARIPAGGRVPVKAGLHKVASVTQGRGFVESESLLESLIPGAGGGPAFGGGGGGGRGGRGGAGGGLQVIGPYNPTGAPVETANRQRIFVCQPAGPSDETACATKIFANIAHRAFRRPVTDKDLAAPLAFFKEGRAIGDFDAAIQNGLIAILASPKFLYRAEPPPQNLKPGSIYHVSDLDLASRLSFFLWSSIPDDELLGLAEQGKLKDPKIFEQQVRRMLADAKSKTLVSNFGFEWLRVREVDKLDPDMIVYPNFDASLRTAFKREMELFLESVFREDHSALDLLTANYTFVNERLAAHYGIPDVRGDQFRRVTLPDSKRYGLLGKGAILMVTAYPNRTSPVLRGAYILESITGTPPSPPPPNVPPFKENKDGEAAHTVREIMEQHRANPTCNACHGIMDPLGFSLENFDTIGAWRAKDRFAGTVIDASGKLVDGTAVNGPDDLRNALMKRPEQFVQTMTEKLMIYALGRTLEPYDMPIIRKIVRDAASDKYRFSSLVMGIVTSPPFQMNKIQESTAPATVAAAERP